MRTMTFQISANNLYILPIKEKTTKLNIILGGNQPVIDGFPSQRVVDSENVSIVLMSPWLTQWTNITHFFCFIMDACHRHMTITKDTMTCPTGLWSTNGFRTYFSANHKMNTPQMHSYLPWFCASYFGVLFFLHLKPGVIASTTW